MMEQQLACDLLRAVAVFDKPFMTTAFIAGDMVLLDMLARQGLLSRVPIVFIDTLHLFPETYEFADEVLENVMQCGVSSHSTEEH